MRVKNATQHPRPRIEPRLVDLAPVDQKVDNAIHRINRYPADSMVSFVSTYPLDSVIQPLNNWGLESSALNMRPPRLHMIRKT